MTIPDPWRKLRDYTAARIALGRAGGSLPTKELLDFQLSHARARDAVHHAADFGALRNQIRNETGIEGRMIASAANDRMTYLRRPDLGRRLSDQSRNLLLQMREPSPPDVLILLGDGLSGYAIERNGPPLLAALLPLLKHRNWNIAPLLLAQHSRVALQDECGEILGVRISLMLIGERPGLNVPDSLAVYFTWAPRKGRHDADRNCVSNIRDHGLPPTEAASRLVRLMEAAFTLELSGVRLKDDSALLDEQTEARSIEIR